MNTPWLMRIARVVIVVLLLSCLRGAVLYRRAPASVMESSGAVAYRIVVAFGTLIFSIFALRETIRPGKRAKLYILLFFSYVLFVSLISPHTRSLARVLVFGPSAYRPAPGLVFEYTTQAELMGAAYGSAVFHVVALIFILVLGISPKVDAYLARGKAADLP